MFEKELILFLDKEYKNKSDLLTDLSKTVASNAKVTSAKDYEKAVKERESTISTFIGYDTAIPHAKTDAVKTPFVVYTKLSHPLDWDGNGEMVDHIFMIGVPKEAGSNLHMRIISELSKNIMRNAWRESFMNAASVDEAYDILKLIEKEVM